MDINFVCCIAECNIACSHSIHQAINLLTGILKARGPQRRQVPCSSFNTSMEPLCCAQAQLLGRLGLVWFGLARAAGAFAVCCALLFFGSRFVYFQFFF